MTKKPIMCHYSAPPELAKAIHDAARARGVPVKAYVALCVHEGHKRLMDPATTPAPVTPPSPAQTITDLLARPKDLYAERLVPVSSPIQPQASVSGRAFDPTSTTTCAPDALSK